MKKTETYILVWIDETEKWHYFKERFDESTFPDGYVAYTVWVEDGVIIEDEWRRENKGKRFDSCYDMNHWQAVV